MIICFHLPKLGKEFVNLNNQYKIVTGCCQLWVEVVAKFEFTGVNDYFQYRAVVYRYGTVDLDWF